MFPLLGPSLLPKVKFQKERGGSQRERESQRDRETERERVNERERVGEILVIIKENKAT